MRQQLVEALENTGFIRLNELKILIVGHEHCLRVADIRQRPDAAPGLVIRRQPEVGHERAGRGVVQDLPGDGREAGVITRSGVFRCSASWCIYSEKLYPLCAVLMGVVR